MMAASSSASARGVLGETISLDAPLADEEATSGEELTTRVAGPSAAGAGLEMPPEGFAPPGSMAYDRRSAAVVAEVWTAAAAATSDRDAPSGGFEPQFAMKETRTDVSALFSSPRHTFEAFSPPPIRTLGSAWRRRSPPSIVVPWAEGGSFIRSLIRSLHATADRESFRAALRRFADAEFPHSGPRRGLKRALFPSELEGLASEWGGTVVVSDTHAVGRDRPVGLVASATDGVVPVEGLPSVALLKGPCDDAAVLRELTERIGGAALLLDGERFPKRAGTKALLRAMQDRIRLILPQLPRLSVRALASELAIRAVTAAERAQLRDVGARVLAIPGVTTVHVSGEEGDDRSWRGFLSVELCRVRPPAPWLRSRGVDTAEHCLLCICRQGAIVDTVAASDVGDSSERTPESVWATCGLVASDTVVVASPEGASGAQLVPCDVTGFVGNEFDASSAVSSGNGSLQVHVGVLRPGATLADLIASSLPLRHAGEDGSESVGAHSVGSDLSSVGEGFEGFEAGAGAEQDEIDPGFLASGGADVSMGAGLGAQVDRSSHSSPGGTVDMSGAALREEFAAQERLRERIARALNRSDCEDPGPGRATASVAASTVVGWGRGEYGVIGHGGEDDAPSPVPVLFPPDLGAPRVVQIACGWYHSAIVTDLGFVYTWGNGADGALGDGSGRSRPHPSIVPFFGVENPLFATSVACGGDVLGSHTLVIARGTLADEGEASPEPASSVAALAVSKAVDAAIPQRAALSDSEDEARKQELRQAGSRGRVYGFGLGTALGVGEAQGQLTPLLLEDPELNAEDEGGVVMVGAGGGFGVALTRAGSLFSWGRWDNGRLGRGPAPVIRGSSLLGPTRAQRPKYSLAPGRVKGPLGDEKKDLEGWGARHVAAGEAHCIAVDRRGRLWGWGKGSSGQLGTGGTLDVLEPRRIRASQVVREVVPSEQDPAGFEVTVRRAPVRFFRSACGIGHSLAVAVDGSVWSWGGSGGDMLGHADRSLRSVAQAAQEGKRKRAMESHARKDLEIGETSTERPLEESQRVAHAQGIEAVADEAARKARSHPETSDSADGPLVGARAAAFRRRRPWLWPRRVRALPGAPLAPRVVVVAAGAQHSVAVTERGEVYVWGEASGPLLGVPGAANGPSGEVAFALPNAMLGASGQMQLTPLAPETMMGRVVHAAAYGPLNPDSKPLNVEGASPPGAVWTPDDVSVAACTLAAVGGWHTLVVSEGSCLAADLRGALPPSLSGQHPPGTSIPSVPAGHELSPSQELAEDLLQDHHGATPGSGCSWIPFSTCPGPIGGHDVVLWAGGAGPGEVHSGTPIRAHAAVLALRSVKFASMLRAVASKERADLLDSGLSSPDPPSSRPPAGVILHLPLPSLPPSVAALLVESCYVDLPRHGLSPIDPRLRELRDAAADFGLVRLEALCRLLLASPLASAREGTDAPGDDDEAEQELAHLARLCATDTLASDLVLGLLDTRWHDVVFIAQGVRFPAHRVIVCARSPYFRAILLGPDGGVASRGGDGEGTKSLSMTDTQESPAMPGEIIEVELPDSAMGLLRMLVHAYTGYLPPPDTAADPSLDLVTADRYGCVRQRSLAASLVPVGPASAARSLEVADAVGEAGLRERALICLLQHLESAASVPAFEALRSRNPDLMSEIERRLLERDSAFFRRYKHASTAMTVVEGALPTVAEHSDVDTEDEAEEEEPERPDPAAALDDAFPTEPFPWGMFVLLIVLMGTFVMLSRLNVSVGWAVPAINAVVLVGVLVYTFRTVLLPDSKASS
jgi:alpha-tubulin suppressor-like RCC1 family protein